MEKKLNTQAGVIDIGSNSIKLIIGEADDQDLRIVDSLKMLMPLGNYTFFKGNISQEALKQTITILEKYKKVLQEYGVSNVITIATTAVREAQNSDIFVDTIFHKTGLMVDVLTVGDVIYYTDAYLAYKLKNKYPLHSKNILIAELGAGSVDVSVMEKGFTLLNLGISIGTLKLKQLVSKLDGSVEDNYEVINEYIENEFSYLKRAIPNYKIDDIIIIDENYAQYLANILGLTRPETTFYKLKEEDIKQAFSLLIDKTSEEIAKAYKIPMGIAETITAYIMILSNFLKINKSAYLYIQETSLAEAILANNILGFELAKKYNKINQLISVAHFICNKYNVDLAHSEHVAKLSKIIFENLYKILGLEQEDQLHLILAAYLHDIGMFIHNRSHHKHSEYLINSFSLFRLSDEDIKIIACIARYHRKTTPRDTHQPYSSLTRKASLIVQKLSAILRVANALDRSHKQKIKKLEVEIAKNQDINLIVYTSANFQLEKLDFLEKKESFEEIIGNKLNLIIKQ